MCREVDNSALFVKVLLTLLFIGCLSLISASYLIGGDYSRDAFKHWSDLDQNGFNSREDALLDQAVKSGDMSMVAIDGDTILSGIWVCPYTGEVFNDPSKMDVDHIVPLLWAWEHGAKEWTAIQREMFANDPSNLLVVSADVNRAKGAKGPEGWLPPNLRYADTYVQRFIYICTQYNLDTPSEKYLNILEDLESKQNGLRP